jgi:hypothetical protein
LYKWEVIPVCNLRTPVSVSSQDPLKFIFYCNETLDFTADDTQVQLSIANEECWTYERRLL